MNNKYIAYLHSCWLSQKELTEIFTHENSPEDFFTHLSDTSLSSYISSSKRRENILNSFNKLSTKQIDTKLEKFGVNIIVLWDSDYPESLLHIPHTPYILYVRWKIPSWDMFWVVWSRKISSYWDKIIKQLVPDIANVFPIVSGWAAWCDTLAHKVCIDSWKQTVVVVWTWIDQTYPVSNQNLFQRVVESWGAIVSIFRIWEPGNPYNFPVRNEIVVGLSRWILVVEAKEKSWSLITASLSLDLWKDLFSVPWDIFSIYHQWTNKLIKKWEAKCVTQISDILEEYNVQVKQIEHKNILTFSDEVEKLIYDTIARNSWNIDMLSDVLAMSPQKLLIKVSALELKWVIKKDMYWKYELV